MPPLLLDDEEAIAVALGLRIAATGSIEGVQEASVRALLKIEQILPSRLSRRLGRAAIGNRHERYLQHARGCPYSDSPCFGLPGSRGAFAFAIATTRARAPHAPPSRIDW